MLLMLIIIRILYTHNHLSDYGKITLITLSNDYKHQWLQSLSILLNLNIKITEMIERLSKIRLYLFYSIFLSRWLNEENIYLFIYLFMRIIK